MVFDVRFGIPGFVVVILLLAAIPMLIAVSGWLYQELRNTRARLRRLQSESSPPRLPSRNEEAYQYFIATLSHQTSNALQATVSALSNLRHHLDTDENSSLASSAPDQQHYLQQIEEETQHLLAVTGKLRLLAQLEMEETPIAFQPVQLRGAVADVIMRSAEKAQAQSIELLYHGPSRPPRVLANREQITQALQNLVDNSLKYARPDSREIVLSIAVEPNCLRVSIADDGIGISHVMLPHIFDSAYRVPDPRIRRQSGSGLGLAIVRRIVERHGGQIDAQSIYGEGTLITFTLPQTTPDLDG